MFSYSQLNREASEIRLVRFKEPASASPNTLPIELELCSVSLKDNPHYAAVSYVWGCPDISTAIQIYVNGRLFTIGREIHIALTQLRQNNVQSWLWVDSICINQPDLEEKSWQVAQMHKIFSSAKRVYIWLGLSSSETDKAMDFVARVGPRALDVGVLALRTNVRLQDSVSQYLKKLGSSSEVADRHDESSFAGKELADFFFNILREPELLEDPITGERGSFRKGSLTFGISDILQRDYWHRIWIIQEVSLAYEATVLCGEKAVELEHFDAAFSTIEHCMRFGFRTICHETRKFGGNLPANFFENIALSTRRKHRHLDRYKSIRLAIILFHNGLPPGRPHYSATDARDIVFALLGIITDGEALGLRVDYSMTLERVFTALTRALIYDGDDYSHGYTLDRCVPRQAGGLSLDLFPSWVPDWRVIGQHGAATFPVNHYGKYNATIGAPAPPPRDKVNEDDIRGLLRRPGCRVDVITEVMQPPQYERSSEWSVPYIINGEGLLASIRDFAKLGPESGPGEDYVWRTVMFDLYYRRDRSNGRESEPIDSEKATIIRKLMRRTSINPEILTETQKEIISHGLRHPDYLPSISKVLEKQLEHLVAIWPKSAWGSNHGRTLFKTTKGMFGLGHLVIRPGDIVTLLWGVRSPIVLRPRNDRDGGGFTFAGDAYVDGIMNGEFLDTLPAHVDFEIY